VQCNFGGKSNCYCRTVCLDCSRPSFWRKLCDGRKFTVGVIPDTQNYVDYANYTNPAALQRFVDETTYLANNKTALNLAYVTHVGDVVQHGDLSRSGDAVDGEWKRAQTALNVLADANVPFGLVPGNHDYANYSHSTGSRPLSGNDKWNQYFGPDSSFYAGKSWYGGSYNGGMDSFQTFTGGGKTFLSLELEMDPSNGALAWAQSVIDSHPGLATIITTHSFLNPTTNVKTQDNSQARANDISTYFPGTSVNNTPDQVWSKLIEGNDQIFMVLCGHNWNGTDSSGVSNGENLRIDNNDFGHPVYQVLSDLQGNTFSYDTTTGTYTPGVYTGGEGWLRLMEFDTEANTIHFQTYSPTLGLYAGVGDGPNFKLDPSFSDFTLPIPIQAKAVPEPSTLTALFMGGLTFFVSKRKAKA